MKYWQTSFGYFAAIACIVLTITGHIIIWLIDGRLRRNLIIRLREKARIFELEHASEMQRHDCLYVRVPNKKPVATTKKTFVEGQEEKKESEEGDGTVGGFAQPHKKRRKVKPMKKKAFLDEEDEEEDEAEEREEEKAIMHMNMGGDQAANEKALEEEMAAIKKAKEERKI